MRAERVVAFGLGRAGRVVALVLGVLLMLPGIAMVTAGGTLGAGSVLGRDSGGYVRAEVAHFQSGTAAVTAGASTIVVDAGTPQWLVDRLAIEVRLDVARGDGAARFVGIAPAADVDAYLAG